jgi:hypothetical protein
MYKLGQEIAVGGDKGRQHVTTTLGGSWVRTDSTDILTG